MTQFLASEPDIGDRAPGKAMIPTYLSHSYRREDRFVNELIWRLFHRSGFAFTVDPKSSRLSIAHLEYTLRYSACFVGIVTRRDEEEYYRTSPYLIFEYELAARAQKPRLVFVENNVALRYFAREHRIVFQRQANGRVLYNEDEVEAAIERLRRMALPHIHESIRTATSVGLALPKDGPYEAVMPRITTYLERSGYEVKDVPHQYNRLQTAWQLMAAVDSHDFIVMDVGASVVSPELHSMLYGHFFPMVRLIHHSPGEQADAQRPEILRGELMDRVAKTFEIALPWHDPEQLLAALDKEVEKLRGERRQFHTLDEGLRYFKSLGRSLDLHVFVSNANEQNDFADQLCRLLDLNNIRFFHYVYHTDVKLGTPWRDELLRRLESSQIFVALMTKAFLKSEICMEEWQVAYELAENGRIHLFAFILEDVPSVADFKLNLQAARLVGRPAPQQLEAIVTTVDSQMNGGEPDDELSWKHDQNPMIDVAFVTVVREEYTAVLQRLSRVERVPLTRYPEDRYRWVFGEVPSSAEGRPYRVVLGMAGQQGAQLGQLITRDAIEMFKPSYVLLVGIAGGIGERQLGDVVVADRIYGYEYGRVRARYQPRPNWTYATDTAVVTAALAIETLAPTWHQDRIRDASGKVWVPRVHVGPVASGSKVVEDVDGESFKAVMELWPDLNAVEMEGLGAVEAIRDARERKLTVNFAMVRGISDLPLSKSVESDEERKDPEEQRHGETRVIASDAAAILAIEMIRLAWSSAPRSSRSG